MMCKSWTDHQLAVAAGHIQSVVDSDEEGYVEENPYGTPDRDGDEDLYMAGAGEDSYAAPVEQDPYAGEDLYARSDRLRFGGRRL